MIIFISIGIILAAVLTVGSAIFLCLKNKIYFGLIAMPNEDVITHTKPIPIIGGLLIFSVTIPVLLAISFYFDYSIQNYLLGIILLWLLGFYKDKIQKPFSPIIQFIIQGFATFFLYYQWISINSIAFQWIPMLVFILVCNVLLNAFNFLDVMDGLAGSFSLVVFLLLSIVSGLSNQYAILFISSFCLGANLIFLIYNWNPAKLFLGDIGSFGIMYTLIFISLSSLPYNGVNSFVILFFIFSIPIFEFVFTCLRRIIQKKLPYQGDANHASLLLLNSGWKSKKIAMSSIYITTISCTIAFWLITNN